MGIFIVIVMQMIFFSLFLGAVCLIVLLPWYCWRLLSRGWVAKAFGFLGIFGYLMVGTHFIVWVLFPQWMDSTETRYHMRALAMMAAAGQVDIPLRMTTDFDWSAVCFLSAYDDGQFIPSAPPHLTAGTEQEYMQALGIGPAMLERLIIERPNNLIFRTPEGLTALKAEWGRFNNLAWQWRAYSSMWRKGYHVSWYVKGGDQRSCGNRQEFFLSVFKN